MGVAKVVGTILICGGTLAALTAMIAWETTGYFDGQIWLAWVALSVLLLIVGGGLLAEETRRRAGHG